MEEVRDWVSEETLPPGPMWGEAEVGCPAAGTSSGLSLTTPTREPGASLIIGARLLGEQPMLRE